MEIVLEDTKDAVGGSWVIVLMDDDMIFYHYAFNGFIIMGKFYYYGYNFLLLWVNSDPQVPHLFQRANQEWVGVVNWILYLFFRDVTVNFVLSAHLPDALGGHRFLKCF